MPYIVDYVCRACMDEIQKGNRRPYHDCRAFELEELKKPESVPVIFDPDALERWFKDRPEPTIIKPFWISLRTVFELREEYLKMVGDER